MKYANYWLKILLMTGIALNGIQHPTYGYFNSSVTAESHWRVGDWTPPSVLIYTEEGNQLIEAVDQSVLPSPEYWSSHHEIKLVTSEVLYLQLNVRQTSPGGIRQFLTIYGENDSVLLERVIRDQNEATFEYFIPLTDITQQLTDGFQITLELRNEISQLQTDVVRNQHAQLQVLAASTFAAAQNQTERLRFHIQDVSEVALVCTDATGAQLTILQLDADDFLFKPESDGSYVLQCNARDAAGNQRDLDPIHVLIDSHAPEVLAPTAVKNEGDSEWSLEFPLIDLTDAWQKRSFELVRPSGEHLILEPQQFLPAGEQSLWLAESQLMVLNSEFTSDDRLVISMQDSAGNTNLYRVIPVQ